MSERMIQVAIMLVIGAAAGAASFTHVHDVAAAHGQPGWLAWADAVVLQPMSVASGLELRRRKRLHAALTFPAVVLGVAVALCGSADLSVVASCVRNVASLCRREGHHDAAQHLALDASMALLVDGPRPDPTHLSLYGMLLLNAAYSAARPETGLARPGCSSSPTNRPDISARHATTAGRLSGLPR